MQPGGGGWSLGACLSLLSANQATKAILKVLGQIPGFQYGWTLLLGCLVLLGCWLLLAQVWSKIKINDQLFCLNFMAVYEMNVESDGLTKTRIAPRI
jgi:hypothetical protein